LTPEVESGSFEDLIQPGYGLSSDCRFDLEGFEMHSTFVQKLKGRGEAFRLGLTTALNSKTLNVI
jgi:hypothetical protein